VGTYVYGVRIDADQAAGNNYSTYGLYSDTDSLSTSNVYGAYANSRGEGTTYGVYGYGFSYGSNTYGVTAYASQATDNTSPVYGFYGSAYAYGTGNLYGARNYANHGGTAGTSYGTQSLCYGSDAGTTYGVYGAAYNGTENYGGYFLTSSETGIPVVGLQSSTYTISDLPAWQPGGFFGGRNGVIGFTEEASGYGVYGRGTANSTRGVYGYATGDNVTGVYGYAYAGTDEDYPRGVYAYASGAQSDGIYATAYGTDATGGYFYGSGTNAIGIYAYGSLYAADFNGNVRIRDGGTTVMELGAGLDYAEGFDVSGTEKPSPGSVLIIDPDNPGKLTLSRCAYDTKVAGIVAGANGLGSGVRLGADQFDNDVALAGRVFCKVDATHTAIKTGDLLTTADLPGHAMKAGDYARAQGAILGKAMQDLEKGERGEILVLVTLQ
jgi:hypothetical protein